MESGTEVGRWDCMLRFIRELLVVTSQDITEGVPVNSSIKSSKLAAVVILQMTSQTASSNPRCIAQKALASYLLLFTR